jgi:hypothetical protein
MLLEPFVRAERHLKPQVVSSFGIVPSSPPSVVLVLVVPPSHVANE